VKTIRILATNTMAQLVGKVVTAGSTILITRLIAGSEGLGRVGYNDFAIITAYAAYFYILTDFGLNAIGAKEITQDESRGPRYVSNLLTMRLVMSLALIMLGLAILAFLPYSVPVKLGSMLMLVTVVGQAIFTNNNVLFQAKLRYHESVIASIVGSLVSLGLAFVVYAIGGGLFGYILAMVIGSASMAIMSLILVGRYVPLRLTVDLPLWRHLALAALPLGVTIILNLAYFKSDTFILSVVNGDPSMQMSGNADWYDVGLYNMAYKVFEVFLVIPIYVVNVLYPMLVKQAEAGAGALKEIFFRALGGLLALSLIMAAGTWVFAPLMIDVVSAGNEQFAASVDILRWLGLSIPLFFVSNLLLWTIMTLGRQRVLAFYYGVAAVVNIGLNIWLIPQYGYWAAVGTTALTELITLVLMGIEISILFGRNDRPPAADEAVSVEEVGGVV
jgi:O-antigen/teichoic acid export membrane protein